jgi:hypothetical protein
MSHGSIERGQAASIAMMASVAKTLAAPSCANFWMKGSSMVVTLKCSTSDFFASFTGCRTEARSYFSSYWSMKPAWTL